MVSDYVARISAELVLDLSDDAGLLSRLAAAEPRCDFDRFHEAIGR